MHLFGHTKQFRQALENHRDRLFRIAFSWSHDRQVSDDLAQETLSRALKHREKITDPRALEVWLVKVMTNCWRDMFRQARESVDVESALLESPDEPENEFNRMRIVNQVQQAIRKLNLDQRQVITLIALQGYAYEEVADILAIPVGTVMSRVCRARQNLKLFLRDLSTTPGDTSRIRRIK